MVTEEVAHEANTAATEVILSVRDNDGDEGKKELLSGDLAKQKAWNTILTSCNVNLWQIMNKCFVLGLNEVIDDFGNSSKKLSML